MNNKLEIRSRVTHILSLVLASFYLMTIVCVVLCGWSMSRRAILLWFPDNAEALARVRVWPVFVAGAWAIAHVLMLICLPRVKRVWHGLLTWCLITLGGACALVLVWYSWVPIASALFKN